MTIHVGDTLGNMGFGRGPVFIESEKHAAVFGATGAGKTTLMKRVAIELMRAGHGLMFVDPHGEAVDDLLEYIPRHRTGDVVIFDPSSEKPIGLNPLRQKTQRSVDEFVKVLAEVYGEGSFMARSSWVARNVGYAVVEAEDKPTPWHFYMAFVSKTYREKMFALSHTLTLKNFSKYFDSDLPERQREEATAAPLNKADAVMANYTLRHIFGQWDGLDLYDCMQKKKIVLCPLRKGLLGPEVVPLLGSVLVQMAQFAAFKRTTTDYRPAFTIFVDEFHNMTKGSGHEHLLSEARKYKVFLWLADQTLAQLPRDSEAGILGNVGLKIFFKVQYADAERLAPNIGLENPDVLAELPMGDFYLQNGSKDKYHVHPLSWVNERKSKKPIYEMKKTGHEARKEDVLRYSYEHYGRAREEIEAELATVN